jgi:GT2 family glycosyltransferase
MERPCVTVGILTRNSEKTIEKCLASVINSSLPKNKMQIIIVDNASEDKTLEIAKKMLETSAIDHKILINEKLGTIGRSRQMVVDNSCAEYVLWIDSDAVIPPKYLESQLCYIRQSGAAIVFPLAILAINVRSVLARMQGYAWSISTMNALKTGKTPFLGALGTIMKVDIIREVGGFDTQRVGGGEDLELILKVKRKGYKIAVNPNAKIYHYMKEKWRDIVNNLRFWGSINKTTNQGPRVIICEVASLLKSSLAYVGLSVLAFSEFKDLACLLIPVYMVLWKIINLA